MSETEHDAVCCEPTPEYEGLKTFTLKARVLYGPIESRRLGWSLGVNLQPPDVKLCTFDCIYCQLGLTTVTPAEAKSRGLAYPSVEAVCEEMDETFARLAAEGPRPAHITYSGNGEPTMHPAFDEVCDVTVKLRDRHLPGARISCLTNGHLLANDRVVRGLNVLDERHVKLDAGTQDMLDLIDGPIGRLDLERFVGECQRLRDVTVQSFFLRGDRDGVQFDNTTPDEVAAWIALLRRIRPVRVELYTLDRVPPVGGLEAIATGDLGEMARRVSAETGIPAEAY